MFGSLFSDDLIAVEVNLAGIQLQKHYPVGRVLV
jgi:hypothetical protein